MSTSSPATLAYITSTDSGWCAMARSGQLSPLRSLDPPDWIVVCDSPDRDKRYVWPTNADGAVAPMSRQPTSDEVETFLRQCMVNHGAATVTQ